MTSSISGGSPSSPGATGTNENETSGTGANETPGTGQLVEAPDSEIRQAVELEAGQVYEGGALVKISSLGISFEIPEGWRGGLAAGTGFLLLGSDARPGFVLSTSQQSTSVNDVMAMLSQAFPLDATTILMPNALPQVEEGGWVRGQYTGSDGFNTLAGFAMALVDPGGKGILYVVAGPRSEADYYSDLLAQLVSSTESGLAAAGIPPDTTELQVGDNSPLAQEWTQHIAGRHMTYMSTFGGSEVGSSTRRDLYICRDGRFLYYEEGLVALDVSGVGASSGGQDDDQGQWRILTQGSQAGLELRWSSGEVSAHALNYVDGETYLDEDRWFVTDDNTYC